jgi:hypothetical protein
MSHRRIRFLALLLACGALTSGAAAQAATTEPLPKCGTTPKGASEPVKATLALADTDPETVVAALYGRGTGIRQLTLVYKVTGCRMTATLPGPADPPPIGPAKDGKVATIPYGVIRLDGTPQIDRDQYIVRLKVWTAPPPIQDADGKSVSPTFDPGSYGGFLHLKASWMHRVGTPVAVSRSENRWAAVLALAAIGALGGFLVFCIVHQFSQSELLVGWRRLLFAGVFSVGIGAALGYQTIYLNQDVWTFSANGIALVTAAFTAATSGHFLTGMLSQVYTVQKQARADAKATGEQRDPGVAAQATG